MDKPESAGTKHPQKKQVVTPGLRLQIGSLREPKRTKSGEPLNSLAEKSSSDQPVHPKPADPSSDVPSAGLSSLPVDMEREVVDALGGLSVDDLLQESEFVTAETELASESRLQARVVKLDREHVFLEMGGRNQGVIPLRQFDTPPQVGSQLDVLVRRFDSADELYELAIPGTAIAASDWSQIAEGATVEAVITGHNQGGLEARVGMLPAFIPASQVSLYHVDDLEQFVGQKQLCIVKEATPRRGNLVLSHRAVLEREKAEVRDRLWDTLEVGQICEGLVRSLKDFGAFVDLGGVDGLVHISKLSWDRINHPREVLTEGEKVRVRIEKIDRAAGKIALTYRDLADNPWKTVSQRYATSMQVTGTITKILDFGVLVKLEPGVSGLIHISELAHRRVDRISQVVREGQEVRVVILSVDSQAQRIALSLKALEVAPENSSPAGDAPEPSAAASQSNRKQSQKSLRGGLEGGAGGDRFGLKW